MRLMFDTMDAYDRGDFDRLGEIYATDARWSNKVDPTGHTAATVTTSAQVTGRTRQHRRSPRPPRLSRTEEVDLEVDPQGAGESPAPCAHPRLRSEVPEIPTRGPRSRMPSGIEPAAWLITPSAARHALGSRANGTVPAEPPIMR
jgi:hypothetical protein